MNPYNLNWEKFKVAVEPRTDAVVGCGQLVPLGNTGSLELRSLIVEPSHRRVPAAPTRSMSLLTPMQHFVMIVTVRGAAHASSRRTDEGPPNARKPATFKCSSPSGSS